MTNKEIIIIDGIDVSGCILRRRKEPNCIVCNGYSSKVFEFDCSDFKNCYFKQLKRKEQECDELISEKDFYLQKIETLEDKCEELKEENEELNKRNNFLLQRLEVDDTDTSLVFKLQRELENSRGEFYLAIKSELKYKDALDEIEKYAKENNDLLQGYHYEWANNKIILEIINKTKDGNNDR